MKPTVEPAPNIVRHKLYTWCPAKGVLIPSRNRCKPSVVVVDAEYVCPAKPYKAIYVEGLEAHNTLQFKKWGGNKSGWFRI